MFTGDEQHEINIDDAAEITKRYREAHPGERIAVYFSKSEITSLLGQTNCVGIRIYFGMDDGGELSPIIVGVDTNENDLVRPGEKCLDFSLPCPNRCSTPNKLNT